jgi:hypothetical protein
MLSDKFKSVPMDEDTKILHREERKISQYDVLHEKWYWDGITAESIIFANEDLADLDDVLIERLVRSSDLFKSNSSLHIQHSNSEFTFVNLSDD